jgi:hypothetical protein
MASILYAIDRSARSSSTDLVAPRLRALLELLLALPLLLP